MVGSIIFIELNNHNYINMKYKFLKSIMLLAITSTVATSCIKNKVEPLGDKGTTMVKFFEGGSFSVKPMEILPTLENLELAELRRDANSESSLNSAVEITFTNSQEALDAYNTENDAEYEFLPDDAYTVVTSGGISVSGTSWKAAFAPGDFAKSIAISLDKSKLDFSKSYAFAFKILDGGGTTVNTSEDLVIVNPIVKNQYHGSYHAAGVFHHPTAGDRDIDEDKELITAGLTSVKAPLGDLGTSGYYMILNVNPDNTVTITPSGATPNIDQSWGPNFYDPVEKAFHLFYSYNTAAPRKVEETITLK